MEVPLAGRHPGCGTPAGSFNTFGVVVVGLKVRGGAGAATYEVTDPPMVCLAPVEPTRTTARSGRRVPRIVLRIVAVGCLNRAKECPACEEIEGLRRVFNQQNR